MNAREIDSRRGWEQGSGSVDDRAGRDRDGTMEGARGRGGGSERKGGRREKKEWSERGEDDGLSLGSAFVCLWVPH